MRFHVRLGALTLVLMFMAGVLPTPVAAAPVLSSASCSSCVADSAQHTLTVTGSGFTSTSTLTTTDPAGTNYNSVANRLTLVSSTQINYQIIPPTGTAGTWNVVVKDGSQTSTSRTFTVTAPAAAAPSGTVTLSNDTPDCRNDAGSNYPGVNLRWNYASGTGVVYDLYRDGSLNAARTGLTTNYFYNGYSGGGVAAGSSHTYKITARNSGGNLDSNTITVNIPSNVCGSTGPTGTVTLVNDSPDCRADSGTNYAGVNLRWSAATGSGVVYDLYRDGSLSGARTGLTTLYFYNGYSGGGVVAGNSYTYKVTARNAGGNLDSNAVTVNIPSAVCGPTGPSAPTGPITLSNDSPDCRSDSGTNYPGVNLRWNAASGTSVVYDLYRDGSLSAARTDLTTLYFYNGYSGGGVLAGHSYTYKVTARNSGGSLDSNTITVSIPSNTCATTPTAPTGPITLSNEPPICDSGYPAVRLNWNAASGNSVVYDLYRDGSLNSARTGLTGTTFYNAYSGGGLAAGQGYTFKVTAQNSGGSIDSNTISVAIPGNVCVTTPTAPTGPVTLTNETPVCDSGYPAVRLNWNAASGSSVVYDLYRDSSLNAARTGISGTTFYNGYSGGDVVAGNSYTYKVTARNAGGNIDSNTIAVAIGSNVCGTTPTQGPKGPITMTSGSTVCESGHPAVQLNWNAASGSNVVYDVYRGGARLDKGTAISQTTFYDSAGLTPGQSYAYNVTARNAGGNLGTNVVTVEIPNSVCPPQELRVELSNFEVLPRQPVVGGTVVFSTMARNPTQELERLSLRLLIVGVPQEEAIGMTVPLELLAGQLKPVTIPFKLPSTMQPGDYDVMLWGGRPDGGKQDPIGEPTYMRLSVAGGSYVQTLGWTDARPIVHVHLEGEVLAQFRAAFPNQQFTLGQLRSFMVASGALPDIIDPQANALSPYPNRHDIPQGAMVDLALFPYNSNGWRLEYGSERTATITFRGELLGLLPVVGFLAEPAWLFYNREWIQGLQATGEHAAEEAAWKAAEKLALGAEKKAVAALGVVVDVVQVATFGEPEPVLTALTTNQPLAHHALAPLVIAQLAVATDSSFSPPAGKQAYLVSVKDSAGAPLSRYTVRYHLNAPSEKPEERVGVAAMVAPGSYRVILPQPITFHETEYVLDLAAISAGHGIGYGAGVVKGKLASLGVVVAIERDGIGYSVENGAGFVLKEFRSDETSVDLTVDSERHEGRVVVVEVSSFLYAQALLNGLEVTLDGLPVPKAPDMEHLEGGASEAYVLTWSLTGAHVNLWIPTFSTRQIHIETLEATPAEPSATSSTTSPPLASPQAPNEDDAPRGTPALSVSAMALALAIGVGLRRRRPH